MPPEPSFTTSLRNWKSGNVLRDVIWWIRWWKRAEEQNFHTLVKMFVQNVVLGWVLCGCERNFVQFNLAAVIWQNNVCHILTFFRFSAFLDTLSHSLSSVKISAFKFISILRKLLLNFSNIPKLIQIIWQNNVSWLTWFCQNICVPDRHMLFCRVNNLSFELPVFLAE